MLNGIATSIKKNSHSAYPTSIPAMSYKHLHSVFLYISSTSTDICNLTSLLIYVLLLCLAILFHSYPVLPSTFASPHISFLFSFLFYKISSASTDICFLISHFLTFLFFAFAIPFPSFRILRPTFAAVSLVSLILFLRSFYFSSTFASFPFPWPILPYFPTTFTSFLSPFPFWAAALIRVEWG